MRPLSTAGNLEAQHPLMIDNAKLPTVREGQARSRHKKPSGQNRYLGHLLESGTRSFFY
jgi:hypothetical protein